MAKRKKSSSDVSSSSNEDEDWQESGKSKYNQENFNNRLWLKL